jgi:transposase
MYKPHEFAKNLGVSVKTLQRWDASGKLPAKRTVSNYPLKLRVFDCGNCGISIDRDLNAARNLEKLG